MNYLDINTDRNDSGRMKLCWSCSEAVPHGAATCDYCGAEFIRLESGRVDDRSAGRGRRPRHRADLDPTPPWSDIDFQRISLSAHPAEEPVGSAADDPAPHWPGRTLFQAPRNPVWASRRHLAVGGLVATLAIGTVMIGSWADLPAPQPDGVSRVAIGPAQPAESANDVENRGEGGLSAARRIDTAELSTQELTDIAPAAGDPATTPPQAREWSVRDVQHDLRRLGYYAGSIDGQVGPLTRRALRAFQKDAGIAQTGRIDPAVTEALQRKQP